MPEKPYLDDGNQIDVGALPGENAIVNGGKYGRLKLIRRIAEGGEGVIYDTDHSELVCKIYHKDQLVHAKEKKLELMLSRNVQLSNVCWPCSKIINDEGVFVGFSMPKIYGQPLSTTVFAIPLLKIKYPSWTRIELYRLSISVLTAIQSLHRLNVLIGDINPQNILMKSEKEVWVVDADSFQIEGYHCPVGTDTFTPPNRQGKNFKKFLRTFDDELFAVATLVFKIIFNGKSPYSSQGGGEASENIRNHSFAYGRSAEGRPPTGAYQFIWSHLHIGLKEIFIRVFQDGGRVQIKDMISRLEDAVDDMLQGKSNSELIPNKPYIPKNKTVEVVCVDCPTSSNRHQIGTYLYEKLQSKGQSFVCVACRSVRQVSKLERTRVVACGHRVSPECEGNFIISYEKLHRLQRQGKEPWCKICGDVILYGSPVPKRTYIARERGREGLCFVATTVYGSSAAPQVMVLREYRDKVLMKSAAGKLFVRVYYFAGPLLAKLVDTLPVLRIAFRCFLDRLVSRISGNKRGKNHVKSR